MYRRSSTAALLVVALALALAMTAQAFLALPAGRPAQRQRVDPLQMGLFDAIKKGFENEEMSTPAPNAGLKNVRACVPVGVVRCLSAVV